MKDLALHLGPDQYQKTAGFVLAHLPVPWVADRDVGQFGRQVRSKVAAEWTVFLDEAPGLIVGNLQRGPAAVL